MITTVITRQQELLSHRDAILALFSASYDASLPAALWTWAYIDNPCGHPVVALCHDGDALVGHYAIIPLPVSRGGRVLNSYLSMTTMVAPTHRGHGLFVLLARAAYEAATALGLDCVLGFPNANSAPGFRKHLGWQLPAPDRLATFGRDELIAFAAREGVFAEGRFGLDMSEGAVRHWRLAKPGMRYEAREGMVFKAFGDALDLVWCEHERHLAVLPKGCRINVLVSGDHALPPGIPASDYQFGGAALAGDFDPAMISRCMLLSDVF